MQQMPEEGRQFQVVDRNWKVCFCFWFWFSSA